MRTALTKVAAVVGIACMATSCTTMYDSQGRPQQVVTPEGAVFGAVAAGLIGYALNDNDSHRHHRSHYRSNHRGYGGGYYGSGYCR
jgi:hypothetical protein